VTGVLDHQLLRNLRAAATFLANAKDVDVSTLTDDEHTTVDDLLSQIIGDAIRIRSRLGK
jgi:hypothetical protein